MQPGLRQVHRFFAILAADRGYERLRMTNLKGMSKENDCVLRAPAGFSQALIKIYTPCNLPNLFSCQISSSPACTGCPPRRVWVLLPRGVQPLSHPTQCSESTSWLTPNIKQDFFFLGSRPQLPKQPHCSHRQKTCRHRCNQEPLGNR